MQKSIFRRYLSITMMIVILSFVMLGSVMMIFFSRYWRSEKKELLTQNAASISGIAAGFLERQDSMPAGIMQGFLESFSSSIDADIFITDLDGNILLGRFSGGERTEAAVVPLDVVQAAAAGRYEGTGDFGLYAGRYLIIGVPLTAGESGGCVGAVFAATSVKSVREYQWELFKIFLVASAAALLVTFCLVGVFAYRQVKPLRQMSAAARSFGAGDFSVRVPVTSADELGQLAVSFNNMANSLSISEGTRRSFIANVSHELKTPMTTIAGFIDGILDGTIPAQEREKYLSIVSSEVKRLSRLVRSMLDLSRIDNGEMKLNPVNFDVTNTIVTTLLTFEQSIDERNIEIRGLEDIAPQTVYGDPDLLHQVVYNLVENAVKFTNPGGYIRVQVTDGIDRTTVAIENSGRGIPPEELPRVFERFYKTDQSRSQDKNGMGLGLYIVKMILKLHGGDISVTSAAGEFCRFTFYVPKPPEAPKQKEKPKEGKKASRTETERSKNHDR